MNKQQIYNRPKQTQFQEAYSKKKVLLSPEDEHLANLNWKFTRYRNREYIVREERLHKKILEMKIGRSLRPNEVVDHINGNTWDNRRENLRVATMSQNSTNRRVRCNNKTGYKGVHLHPQTGKYYVIVSKDKKRITLGPFDSVKEAAKRYDEKAIEVHGEFARTNTMMGLLP